MGKPLTRLIDIVLLVPDINSSADLYGFWGPSHCKS